jgi:hypothetical protein
VEQDGKPYADCGIVDPRSSSHSSSSSIQHLDRRGNGNRGADVDNFGSGPTERRAVGAIDVGAIDFRNVSARLGNNDASGPRPEDSDPHASTHAVRHARPHASPQATHNAQRRRGHACDTASQWLRRQQEQEHLRGQDQRPAGPVSPAESGPSVAASAAHQSTDLTIRRASSASRSYLLLL